MAFRRGAWRWLAALPLLAVPAWGQEHSPRAHTIEIRGMAFHPEVLTVARGDTVVWINRDIVPHTATGGGRLGWDTGQLSQGQDGRYVPRRAGDAPYICTLHPGMQGKLIIR